MRFKYIILNTIFVLICYQLSGQTIKVIDRDNELPIPDVTAYNQSRTISSISNKNGLLSLDDFGKDETIFVQHISYKSLKIKKSSLQDGDVIALHKKILFIDEFVISAYKWEQKPEEIPNKVTRIDHVKIEFENPQTAADLLGASDEVYIQKSQMGGGSPMIRGFATSSVLMVIDGVRMNNAIYRSGNVHNVLSVDPNIIENSEIIFGPGSVTYGSDALGGVMDFHTKRVLLSTHDSTFVKINAASRYSSANGENMFHVDLNLSNSTFGSLTSFTYNSFNDLEMGSHGHEDYKRNEYVLVREEKDTVITNPNPDLQKYTNYSQYYLLQKFRYRPGDHLNMSYTLLYSNSSDIPRYDRLTQYSGDSLKYATWYYGPQKWMLNNLKILYNDSSLLFDSFKTTLAYQDFEESRHSRKLNDNILDNRTEQLKAFSLNLDFDKETKNGNLFYGLEGVYNNLTSTAFSENIKTGEATKLSTRYPDGKNHFANLAAYLSYKYNPNDKITYIGGIRYNYVYLKSTLEDTTFYKFPFDEINYATSALNGSIGMAWLPSETWQINMNLSTGFHAPNIDDMAKVFDSSPGNVVVPNENIKPEYAYNVDIGITANFNEKTRANISGFFTYLDNAMVRRDFSFNGQDSIIYDGELSNVTAVVNANYAYIAGANFSFNSKFFKDFGLEAFLNYTYGEDQDGLPIRHVAPLFGSIKLKFENEILSASFYCNYNGEISNNELAPSEQSKTNMYATDKNGNPYSPGWATLNLKLSYKINNYIHVFGGIENITDVRYRPYSSGIVAPGRNFYITLRITD